MFFQCFDRFLFLVKGGRIVYFGDIGENFKIMIFYFECNGGFFCFVDVNFVEWMLEVIGVVFGSVINVDWYQVWCESFEYVVVQEEFQCFKVQVKFFDVFVIDDGSYCEFVVFFGE